MLLWTGLGRSLLQYGYESLDEDIYDYSGFQDRRPENEPTDEPPEEEYFGGYGGGYADSGSTPDTSGGAPQIPGPPGTAAPANSAQINLEVLYSPRY